MSGRVNRPWCEGAHKQAVGKNNKCHCLWIESGRVSWPYIQMKTKFTKIDDDAAWHCKDFPEISELGADGAPALPSSRSSSSSADTSRGESKQGGVRKGRAKKKLSECMARTCS